MYVFVQVYITNCYQSGWFAGSGIGSGKEKKCVRNFFYLKPQTNVTLQKYKDYRDIFKLTASVAKSIEPLCFLFVEPSVCSQIFTVNKKIIFI